MFLFVEIFFDLVQFLLQLLVLCTQLQSRTVEVTTIETLYNSLLYNMKSPRDNTGRKLMERKISWIVVQNVEEKILPKPPNSSHESVSL